MRTRRVVIGTVESARASSTWLMTLRMPPGRVLTARPCDSSTAFIARSHGWFFTSAVTLPLMSLPRMIVRPLKAAKPAITSSMLALSPGALDLIILERVEIDDDAHDVRLELRVAHVADTAAILSVVQRDGRGEAGTLQIDHEPRGIREREVLDDRGALQVDDDLDLAAGRHHTHPSDFPVADPPRRPHKGPGSEGGGREQGHR